MSIFPDLPTTQWTKSVKSPLPLIWGDAEMASISGACGLAGSDATRCNRPNPISSHFGASNAELRGSDPTRSRAMAEFTDALTEKHTAFIAKQPQFFTATAAAEGRHNLSPKGYADSFRLLPHPHVPVPALGRTGKFGRRAVRERDGPEV